MMIGIGMPSSQSRIKPMAILLSARASRLIFPRPDYAFPGAVAQLPAFDCGDGLHPSDDGYAEMAKVFERAFEGLLVAQEDKSAPN